MEDLVAEEGCLLFLASVQQSELVTVPTKPLCQVGAGVFGPVVSFGKCNSGV